MMINMLRVLLEKAGNMQEQISNVSREMETVRKVHKETLKSEIL